MQMPVDIVKYVVQQLLYGDVERLWEDAVRAAKSQVPDTVQRITEAGAPVWLRSHGSQQTYRLTDSDYVSVVDGPRLDVEHETDLEAIEIPVASIEQSGGVTFKCTDVSSTRTDVEDRIRVNDAYEYPPVVWKTIDLQRPTGAFELSAEIQSSDSGSTPLSRGIARFTRSSETASTALGSPAIVPAISQPPIILISIDTLRYDRREEFRPVIDELGSDAIIPAEPRTQGTWTPPSHASMFTGTHPGKHGYVGYGRGKGDKRPIDPGLTTIPELLADCGYKCSGLVNHTRLLPEFGFGRGFHRFRHEGMSHADWVTRSGDARESVDQLTAWIDRDCSTRDHSLFYFLHVFDPHFPYTPPLEQFDSPDVDLSASSRYMAQRTVVGGGDWTYVDGYRNSCDVDAELIAEMKSWYSKSVTYTATQIARLLRYLKEVGLFNDSLILVTGDHGEEFGERGFYSHTSLYDDNIRPVMAVKPPVRESWSGRDEIATIDFLPTIATLLNQEIPESCDGIAIQSDESRPSRITERIYANWYNVAVERDGYKGIFTYESNYPDRPDRQSISAGPELTEYYRLSDVRSGIYREAKLDSVEVAKLREEAERFLSTGSREYSADATVTRPSQETVEQLENLGYK